MQDDQLVGTFDRQRPDQQGVADGEHTGRRADCDAKREQRGDSKRRRPAQQSKPQPHVLPDAVEPVQQARVAHTFSSQEWAAEPAQRLAAGLPGRQPVALVGCRPHVEVESHLLVEFAVESADSERVEKAFEHKKGQGSGLRAQGSRLKPKSHPSASLRVP